MANRAVAEHRDVGGTAADVHQAHAEFLFIIGQHRVARRQLLEHHVLDHQAAALYTLDDVLGRAVGAGDDVHLGLEPHARHADRIADPLLAVDDEFLRQHVQDALVGGDRHRLGGIDHVLDVTVRDLAVADRDHAMGVEATYVAAGDAGVDGVDLAVRHQLGFLDRALDRLHGRFDIHHHALLQPARGLTSQTDHLDGAVRSDLAHERDHLGGADIEPDDDVFVRFSSHCAVSCRRPAPAPARVPHGRRRPSSPPRSHCCSACPRKRCRWRAG